MASQRVRHRTLSPSHGGELGRWVDDVTGTTYTCPACGHDVTVGTDTTVRGYRHADGLPDGAGNRWWAYVECPDCEYKTTHDQLPSFRLTSAPGIR